MKKIILLGYMGSGKSTISKLLAERLGLPFLDLDLLIEENLQMSIAAIFKSKGEIFFRKKEHKTLIDTLDSFDSFVLALGGGTPCYSNNHLLLQREDVLSIYLKGSIETLCNRLHHEQAQRPLLQQLGEDSLETFIAKQLFDRSYFYYQAQHVVNIDQKSTKQLVDEITRLLA